MDKDPSSGLFILSDIWLNSKWSDGLERGEVNLMKTWL